MDGGGVEGDMAAARAAHAAHEERRAVVRERALN